MKQLFKTHLISTYIFKSIKPQHMKKFFLYALLLLVVACGSEEKTEVKDVPTASLSKSKNSDAFNQSFKEVMDNYFHLKDDFITESDTLINAFAGKMLVAVDSLKLNELKGDAGIVENAKSFSQSMSAELKGLIAEKTLLNKRKSFNVLTDQLYNLIKVVQYDREIVYHQHCPMAFDEGDANAFWLSRSSDIKNPYRPTSMLECGDVADSLNYITK